MSELDKPSIEELINRWHLEYGVTRRGDGGTLFQIIPKESMLEALFALAKTMNDLGFTYKEMYDPKVSFEIIDICWKESKIKKIPKNEIKQNKLDLTKDWKRVISKYSDIKISKLEDGEKLEVTENSKPIEKEKPVVEKDNRVMKIDTSDMADTPFDPEILAELAAIGTFLKDADE